ncbi:MAG: hypothetical protein RL092_1804 [Bacteroidota bacterium]|jgi:hypothetical protein
MRKKAAYYAHSMRKYNSEIEARELKFIELHFDGNVICPNKDLGELGSIEPYLRVVSLTTAVYATEYRDYVGSGVFDECVHAMSLNIPVYVVRLDKDNNFYVLPLMSIERVYNLSTTFYGRLITE